MKRYLLAAVLLLGGCGPEPLAEFQAPNTMQYDVQGHIIDEFRLADGTRCVVGGGGLACEWAHPVVLVPRPQ